MSYHDIGNPLHQKLKSMLTNSIYRTCLVSAHDIDDLLELRSDTIRQIDPRCIESLNSVADKFIDIGDKAMSAYDEFYSADEMLKSCESLCGEFQNVADELTKILSNLIELLLGDVSAKMKSKDSYAAECNAEAVRISSEIKECVANRNITLHGQLNMCYNKTSS